MPKMFTFAADTNLYVPMSFVENIKSPINSEMQLVEKAFVQALSTDNPLLLSVNEYVLQKSGKQLRPMLVILSARLCGSVTQTTIDGALSLELLHTASLIHDDVVDDTLERRGKPSVNARWTNKIAILSGDYILSKSLECAARTNSLPILKAMANIGMQLSDGELLQLVNANLTEESESNYFNIIRKKTALLFSTCTEVGGLSVGADEEVLVHLRNFGEYLGICFQIKDDIFDYYENIQIGKPTGNDIRDGKVTLPLIHGLVHSDGAEREKILSWIENKEFSAENIQAMTEFAHRTGGVDYALEQMELYKNKAIGELDGFEDSDVKKSLVLCAEYAASRSF
ncbi:MAG TPA: polyprenyl synthetase family protein [Paludibacter sp.]|nr:polyprenyl synthetase family protein [Paludibacter sp.]